MTALVDPRAAVHAVIKARADAAQSPGAVCGDTITEVTHPAGLYWMHVFVFGHITGYGEWEPGRITYDHRGPCIKVIGIDREVPGIDATIGARLLVPR